MMSARFAASAAVNTSNPCASAFAQGEETGTAWNDTLPIGRVGSFIRYYNNTRAKSFQSFLENNKLMVNGSGAQLLAELRELYHID